MVFYFNDEIHKVSYLLIDIDYIINSQMSESQLLQAQRILGSPYSSEDRNRSTVKRLFSSVFSIIDNDSEISHFDDHEQTSRIDTLLDNPTFLSHLHNKINNEGLYEAYKFPILRLSLHPQGKSNGQQNNRTYFDHSDVFSLAARFGQLSRVFLTQDSTQAYIFFYSIANAYICNKLLRAITLRSGNHDLRVEWVHDCGYHTDVANQMHKFVSELKWEGSQETDGVEEIGPLTSKQSKFTCRYDIQIQNQRDFQVARRIIGPKGCNMKRIIEEAVTAQCRASSDNLNQLLKLRLRGKGSGYKEGPQQQESTQNLHLCVSAKDQIVYAQACQKVQKLLGSIYLDFSDYTRRLGKLVQLIVKKTVLGQSFISSEEGSGPLISRGEVSKQSQESEQELYRISGPKIAQLLQLRNKARRQLNFGEADRIRNYLRSVGVCLIDEKGRRGRAADVTTWKYIY